MGDRHAAEELARAGRAREAHATAVRGCAAAPGDADLWRLRARLGSQLGEHADVARCCEHLLGLAPGDAMLWFNLGVARRASGQADGARGALRRALELAPEHAGAHAELGSLERERGEWREAEKHLRTAARLAPQRPDLPFETGLVQLEIREFEAAAASFARVLQLQPQYGPAILQLGVSHEGAGRLDAAIDCYAQARNAQPPVPEAHRRLGRLWARLGHLDEAIDALRAAVREMPEDAATHVYLANALLASQSGPAAEKEAGKLLRAARTLQPDAAAPRLAEAGLLATQGRFEEALALYDAVLAREPGHAAAAAGRVRTHERRGDYAAALAALEPWLSVQPRDLDIALAYASLARRVDRLAGALAYLQGIDPASIEAPRRHELYFARGALRDRMGDYAGAFADIEAANRLTPAQDPAGPFASLLAAYGRLMREHEAERVAARPRASNRSKLPVFIVGMPRSGTSLVEQVLASHPQVYGAGELSAMRRLAASLPRRLGSTEAYPECAYALSGPVLDELASEHLDWLQALAPGAQRITDKMPHNFRWLGLVDQLFPCARVIHCVRDPRDTCLSIWFQPISPGHPYAADLHALGVYYRHYERLMSHWRGVLSVPVLDVNYEDMVENHEATVRRVLEFCNLPWDDRCLRFYEHGRVVNTPSYDQVRRPIYRDSIGRWRHYAAYLEPLQAGLAATPA